MLVLNTTILLGSVAFSISVIEVVLRVLPDAERSRPKPRLLVGQVENRASRNFVADSLTGWRMKENHSFN